MSDIHLFTMRSVLRVGDVDASVAFWQSIGLFVQWRTDDPGPSAGMGGESLLIMLLPADRPHIPPQTIYVTLNGVDAMHARCVAVQPAATSAVEDRDYGMRDFSVTDAWGHTVVFGEARDGSA